MEIINSSAYRFIPLSSNDLPQLKATLYPLAKQLNLKGTILLSPEGINIALSGARPEITQFKAGLKNHFPDLSEMDYDETTSSYQPFQHLFVKIKKQIIPYSDPAIPLNKEGASYVTPKTLFNWLKAKRDIALLDARNQYEVEAGTFENMISLNLKHFRDFPTQVNQLSPSLKQKTIVTFCTGGIRCEKASATLLQQGFQAVYQLKGGILSYFKQFGKQYYQGGCFVLFLIKEKSFIQSLLKL